MPASDFADLFAKPLSKIVFPKSAEVHTFIYHSNNENKARKKFLAQDKSKVIHTNKNKKQKAKITKFNISKPLNKQVLKQVDNSVIETNDPDLKLPERKVSRQHKWPTIKPVTKTWYDNNDRNISPVSPSVPGVDLLGALLNSNLNRVSIGHSAETESQRQQKNDQSRFQKTNQVFNKPIKKPLSSLISNKSIKEIAEKYKKKTSEKVDNIGKSPSDAFNKIQINKEVRKISGSFSKNNNKPLNNDDNKSPNLVKITDASSTKTRTEKIVPTLTSVKRSTKVKHLIGPTKEPIISIDEKSSRIPKNGYLNSSPTSINNTIEEPLQKIEAPKFLKESRNPINKESDNEFVKLCISENKSNSRIFNSSEKKSQFLDFIPSNEKDKCLSLDEILLNISDEIYIERSEQKTNGQQKKTLDQRSDTKSVFEIENFVKAPTEYNFETSPMKTDGELLNQGKTVENQLQSSQNKGKVNSQQRQVLKQSKKNEKKVEKGSSNHKVFFKVENLIKATNSRQSSPIKPLKESPRKQSVDVFDLCFASKKESHDELNLEKVVKHLTKPKTADIPSQVGNISQFSDKEDSDELVIDAAEDDVGSIEHSGTLRKIPRNLYHFKELNSDSDEDEVKESKSDSGCNQGLGNNHGEGNLEEGEIENESDINVETNLKSVEAFKNIPEENLFDQSNKVNLMKNNLRKSKHREKDKLEIHETEKNPGDGIETKKSNNSKLIGTSKRKRKSRDNSTNSKYSKNKEFHNSNQMFPNSNGTNANQNRVYTRKLRSSSTSSISGKSNNTISYNTRRRSDPDHSTSVINEGDEKQRTRRNQRSFVNVKPDHEQVRAILFYQISLSIFQKIFLVIIG